MKKILFLITLALSAQYSLASSEASTKKDPFARYKDNPYLLATAKLYTICNNGLFDEQTFHDAIKFNHVFESSTLSPNQLKQGIKVLAFFSKKTL